MTAWVGLTGGIGSGKSKAAACFALLGVPVIDADAVSRTLTQTPDSEALHQIRQTFGDAVIDSAGCLNRAAMREYVFADEQARQRLEAILHPLNRAAKSSLHFYAIWNYRAADLDGTPDFPPFGAACFAGAER